MAAADSSGSDTIRSAFLYDAFDLRIDRVAPPTLQAGHVALQPKYSGICGAHTYRTRPVFRNMY